MVGLSVSISKKGGNLQFSASIGKTYSVTTFGPDLCVEDPLVEADEVVVGEDEVEVLERLGQEEGLLHVVLLTSDLQ